MTLQGALRFDNAWSYSPAQTIGPALINGQTFLATPLSFDRTDGVNYKDISPRGGSGARRLRQRQDVRQGQRRQVHGSGEQPEQQLLDLQPDRAHCDDGDADVDRQRHRRVGDSRLRRLHPAVRLHEQRRSTANAPPRPRRRSARRQRTTAAIDPALLNGWGIRPRDWQFGASVQQQLLPRVSVEVGYFKRWLQNFTATDNLAVVRRRLHAVQHHGAVRFAAARRRRLPGRRRSTTSSSRSSGRPATTSPTPDFGKQYPELQRHAAQRQRPVEQGADAAGRHQLRQDR